MELLELDNESALPSSFHGSRGGADGVFLLRPLAKRSKGKREIRGEEVVVLSPEKIEASHTLKPIPKTVHIGHLRSDLKPVLSVNSGDVVTVETYTALPPEEYEAAGLKPEMIPQTLRDIFREVKDKGPGPHVLTGPIEIQGAEPGDMLEVHIHEIALTLPFGYNRILVGSGALPDDFPYNSTTLLWIDLNKMTSEIAPGIVIPLRPFFGTLGVAPPPAMGRVNSLRPGSYGGNIDNKELAAGTVLYLPVHVKGALFSVGDAHAIQGDGEVNLTGLETGARGTFQFFVRKKKRIRWPRAETPMHFIAMGLNEDLDLAAQMAVREVIDFLGEAKGIDREDAYRIASLAVDLHVTQVVDGVKGIHAMIPKGIFGGS
jgi:acetamidase/formamidase